MTYSLPRISLRSLAVAVVLAALALALMAPGQASAATCAHAGSHPSTTSIKNIRSATLCLLNQERRSRGIGGLRSNYRLQLAASRHSADMNRRNYFSHYSPGGSSMTSRIRATRYLVGARSWSTGENIAWGSGSWATPRQMMRLWMNSPGHRANILRSSFREVGIGVARGAPRPGVSGEAIYTTNFGARR